MHVNVPAIATLAGTVTPITWNSTGIYSYTGSLFINGSFTSGTFTDTEDATQDSTGKTVNIVGNQSSGSYLLVDTLSGTGADASHRWVGDSSSAIFTPTSAPYLPPSVFIYIHRVGGTPHVLPQNAQNYYLDGTTIVLVKNPLQGTTMKVLSCTQATFTVPIWAKSWTLRNVSGADFFWRRYAPNIEANVIDTTAVTFGEDFIVGQKLEDGQVASFEPGGFTPGSSYMLCAASAATDGAIVEFTP